MLRHLHISAQDTGTIFESGPIVDLFAGTGAWGIEAVSNGAAEAWFVENHPSTLKTLAENLRSAELHFQKQNLAVPRLQLVSREVAQAYPRLPESAVIFCDPPYASGWFEKVVELESRHHRLKPGGIFVYEASVKETAPFEWGERAGLATPALLRKLDSKIYGDSAIHFFVKEPREGCREGCREG